MNIMWTNLNYSSVCMHVAVMCVFFCIQCSFIFLCVALRFLLSLCICITHYFLYIANMAEHNPATSDLRTNEYITGSMGNSSGNTGEGE